LVPIAVFNDARQKRAHAFYVHIDAIGKSEFEGLLKETKAFIDYVNMKIKRDFTVFSNKL